MSTSKTIHLGLIGAGRMGSFHGLTAARHIPGACLAAIADPTPAKPHAWRQNWTCRRSIPTHSNYSVTRTSTPC